MKNLSRSSRSRAAAPSPPVYLKNLIHSFSTLCALDAIYPDDHWSHSTRLTTDNFESSVQAAIDEGKTMFVRWIASSVRERALVLEPYTYSRTFNLRRERV